MLSSSFRNASGVLALAAITLLTSCGDQTPSAAAKSETPKKPSIPEGPISALTAHYQLYKAARSLAPDLQTASITATGVEDAKSNEGKYAQWKIVFVSASKQQAYTFLYSTIEKDNVLRGINNLGSQRWAGPTQSAEPFSNSDFSVDSTAAYGTATQKGKEWLAKNPDKSITTFALGHAARFSAPTWYILWGNPKNGFAAYINASSGAVLK